MSKKIILIVIVSIIIVGGYFVLKLGSRQPAPEPTVQTPVKEITVVGREFSFEPASIAVEAGQKLKITFKNEGRTIHNLIIEGLDIGTKTIESDQSDVIEFTASAPGTYTFFCSVPGHRSSGMEGSLEIK